jgi:hypothetical protein
MNVANYNYDYYIENNGDVALLEKKAIEFLKDIRKVQGSEYNI